MSDKSRRQFLKDMAKAAGIGVLAMFPGSVFGIQKIAPRSKLKIKSKFETTLGNATRKNLKLVLRGAELSNEEKLAVVALKELNPKELEMVISGKLGQSSAGGDVCGIGCGSNCGGTCGISCNVNRGAEAVINPAGKLGIKLRGFNKTKFRKLLVQGLKIQRNLKLHQRQLLRK